MRSLSFYGGTEMIIKLSTTFETYVHEEIDKIKHDEQRLIRLRVFYQKICVEPNQKVNSLRFMLAVRAIEVITDHLNDDYPVHELEAMIVQMKDRGMFLEKPKMSKKEKKESVKSKVDIEIEESSIGFNKIK